MVHMVATDLDDTLASSRDASYAALHRFNAVWQSQCAGGLLVYVTGRSKTSYDSLAASAPLIPPAVLICSVGTEFYALQGAGELSKIADAWAARLDKGWHRERLRATADAVAGLTAQPETELRPHKLSYTVTPEEGDAVVAQLQARLAGESVRVIFSSGRDVDILPSAAGKGNAVRFLLEHLAGVAMEQVLVCGDSGNDIDMLSLAVSAGAKGVVVANAQPELKAWAADQKAESLFLATRTCADGIVEAMTHFGFI